MEAIEKLAQTTALYMQHDQSQLEFDGTDALSPRLRFSDTRVFPIDVTRDVNDSRIYYASVTVK